MNKFLLVGVAIAATAVLSAPAHAITNDAECSSEGGTMVNVKGSDYCLVPIRPEAYHDPIYDGNQLGVTECPGDKLNDDLYCMYPVTIRPQVTAPVTTSEVITPDVVSSTVVSSEAVTSDVVTSDIGSVVTDSATDVVTDMVDDAVDQAVTGGINDATDAIKDAVD